MGGFLLVEIARRGGELLLLLVAVLHGGVVQVLVDAAARRRQGTEGNGRNENQGSGAVLPHEGSLLVEYPYDGQPYERRDFT